MPALLVELPIVEPLIVEPCDDEAPPRVDGPVMDPEGQSELERIRSQLEAMQRGPDEHTVGRVLVVAVL